MFCIGTWVGKPSMSWWWMFFKWVFKWDFCLNSFKQTGHLNMLVTPCWCTPKTCLSRLPFLLKTFPQRLQSNLIPLWSAWMCMSLPPVDLKSFPHHLHGKVLVLVWMVSTWRATFEGLEKDFPQMSHLYSVSCKHKKLEEISWILSRFICLLTWWLDLLWNANPDWLL